MDSPAVHDDRVVTDDKTPQEEGGPTEAELVMAEVLLRTRMILEIPKAHFPAVLIRCYGERATHVVREMMMEIVSEPLPRPYVVESPHEDNHVLNLHLRLLSSLPNSGLAVVQVVAEACSCRYYGLEDTRCSTIFIEGLFDSFDRTMQGLLEEMFSKLHQPKDYPELVAIADEVRTMRRMQGEETGNDAENDHFYVNNPSFVSSAVYLGKWHAHATGLLLARKVSNNRLPPKLVETIADEYLAIASVELADMQRNSRNSVEKPGRPLYCARPGVLKRARACLES